MVSDHKSLVELAHIAKLKSDLELKKLSALNQHFSAARMKVAHLENGLLKCYSSVAPDSISELRSANGQAGRMARELRHAEQELLRLKPRYEAMRQSAIREYGRASAISSLSQKAEELDRRERRNQSDS